MSQMDIIANETASTDQVTYKSIEVDGLNIAYRQSGDCLIAVRRPVSIALLLALSIKTAAASHVDNSFRIPSGDRSQ